MGTESIWIKIAQSGARNLPMLWVASNGTGTINHGAYADFNTNKLYWYTKSGYGEASYSATNSGWHDGNWHLLTVSYSVDVGSASDATIYLDGTALTKSITSETVTRTTDIGNFSQWGVSRDYADTTWGSQGAMDDFAVWGTRLNTTQVSALYNLGIAGVAGTKYNAKDASALFDAFSAGAGVATSDGRTWTYVASGLAGAAGSVGASYVVLNGSGGGMVFAVPVDVTWSGAGSSTWSTAVGSGNWKKTSDATSADYFNGVNVVFNDTATGTSVFIDGADVTPSTITFNDSSKNFTVTGAQGIAGATTTVTKQGTGTVTINTLNTYSGVTTVEAGKLVLQGIAQAMVPALNGAGANIKGGMLVLDYSGEADPVVAIKTLITTSYNAGSGTHFNTGKFQSTTADTTRGLGWIDNTTTNTISIAYTMYGDANLDGSVNFSDLSKLLSKYNQAGVWADGDFNYDGMVDFADLSKLLSTYNQSVGLLIPAGSTSDVPPASVGTPIPLNAQTSDRPPPIATPPLQTATSQLVNASAITSEATSPRLVDMSRATLDDNVVALPAAQHQNVATALDARLAQWALRNSAKVELHYPLPAERVPVDLRLDHSNDTLTRYKTTDGAVTVRSEPAPWAAKMIDRLMSLEAGDTVLSSEEPAVSLKYFDSPWDLDWIAGREATASCASAIDEVLAGSSRVHLT